MALLEVKRLSFCYPDEEQWALKDISFQVTEGEVVVLCGPTGCGKTTLLRLLKRELSPAGEERGEIIYRGNPITSYGKGQLTTEIGMVLQDPENQIVMDHVLHELMFGLENIGLSTDVMRRRVAEMAYYFGLEPLLQQETHAISGGQKQLVNLASVLLLRPRLLLLDEPLAQLDPVAAREFIAMVRRLNEEFGVTVILVEHRLEELFAEADQLLVMSQGRLTYSGAPRQVIKDIHEASDATFLPYVPTVPRLFLQLQEQVGQAALPLTVKEGRACLDQLAGVEHAATTDMTEQTDDVRENVLLQSRNVYFQYEKDSPLVIKGATLTVYEGDFLALVGGNGSGKTTFIQLCAGLLKPQRGKVKLGGDSIHKLSGAALAAQVAYLPQNPKLCFTHDTVEKELHDVVARLDVENGAADVAAMLDRFHLTAVRHRHPYDLSGGEMQKAALASLLLGQPRLLFADEPTKGLDPMAKRELAQMLTELNAANITIVLVTHDVEFAARHAARTAMLFDGQITACTSSAYFFRENYFYTTTLNRMTRASGLPEVLTLEEALARWPSPVSHSS